MPLLAPVINATLPSTFIGPIVGERKRTGGWAAPCQFMDDLT
jgi:hypothetical protein